MSGGLPEDVRVKLDDHELKAVLADFQTRGGNIGNLTPIFAEDICSAIVERFELQSGFQQGQWQDDKQATLDRRPSSASPLILQSSGVMLGSITPFDTPDTAEGYTNVPYAKYHVSPEPRTIIPLRDFTDIDFDALSTRAINVVLDEILGAADG